MSSRFSLETSPIHMLHRAAQTATEVFSTELGEAMTARQLAVLSAISQKDGLSQTAIVDATGIDRSTLAEMMRRLIAKKLIVRKRSKTDTRAYNVSLSDRGRTLLTKSEPIARKIDQKILSALPASRRDEFMKTLDLIARGQSA